MIGKILGAPKPEQAPTDKFSASINIAVDLARGSADIEIRGSRHWQATVRLTSQRELYTTESTGRSYARAHYAFSTAFGSIWQAALRELDETIGETIETNAEARELEAAGGA